MVRLFEQHKVRYQKELEGYWAFQSLETYELPISYSEKMFVPMCWESDIKYCNYRGYGAYKKELDIDQSGYYRLEFKGVSHTCQIYLNGKLIGEHYNAYTGFWVDVFIEKLSIHTLEVLVDNTFSEGSTLHIPNDYYPYGGITRPVVMEFLGDIYIEDLSFVSLYENEEWVAQVEVAVRNLSEDSKEVTLEVDVEALDELGSVSTSIKPGERKIISMKKTCGAVKSWSDSTPNLYILRAQLFDKLKVALLDDLRDRVGFRIVEVDGVDIMLNKQKIFVQGYNRHEDFNIFGCAIPTQGMAVDLAQMKDLGVNSVRTSHYPNDERFLDMCDELGILVWEENHARGLSLERMQKAKFEIQCEQCIDEMITQHKNHPSIILWGILNECSSDTLEGKAMYEKQLKQIRKLDSTRLTTFASDKHFKDLCMEFVDVMSTNIYFGWYDDSKTSEALAAKFEKQYDWLKSAGGDKPLIISEFGAGAIYGYRAPHEPKWSEERQADVLEKTLNLYQNDPRVSGTYIWQYCDVRVTEEEWAMKRPRTQNNKGTVDEYRRPKLAYKTVKRLLTANKI